MLETITTIEGLKEFNELLTNNPGLLIIKFGAEWCGPCKRIESDIINWFKEMPNNVQTAIIDIDESFEIFAYLKNKKMCKSIPVILMYKKGNETYIFDDAVNTSYVSDINSFCERCIVAAENI